MFSHWLFLFLRSCAHHQLCSVKMFSSFWSLCLSILNVVWKRQYSTRSMHGVTGVVRESHDSPVLLSTAFSFPVLFQRRRKFLSLLALKCVLNLFLYVLNAICSLAVQVCQVCCHLFLHPIKVESLVLSFTVFGVHAVSPPNISYVVLEGKVEDQN